MRNWYGWLGYYPESNVEGLMKCDDRSAVEKTEKHRTTSMWTSSHEGTGKPVFF